MARHLARLFTFSLSIGLGLLLLVAEPAISHGADQASAKDKIQGTLVIKGKTYKLVHGVAYATIVSDTDAIEVIVSDRPIDVNKLKEAIIKGNGKPDSFLIFQPQVTVTYEKSGNLMYCNAWADNNSISISGGDKLKGEQALKDGRVVGKASMENGEGEDRKSFDLQFDLALLVVQIPKSEPKTAKAKNSKNAKDSDDDDDDKPADAGPAPHVSELPIPKDATDVEQKEITEQITFKSPVDVKKLSAALARDLAKQGWKKDDSGDLITPQSAILHRTKGGASLTIFVKPAGKGSSVQMMTEGLSWEAKDSSADGDGDEQ